MLTNGWPGSIVEFLPTLRVADPHGEAFSYVTPNTEVLGWIVARTEGPLQDAAARLAALGAGRIDWVAALALGAGRHRAPAAARERVAA